MQLSNNLRRKKNKKEEWLFLVHISLLIWSVALSQKCSLINVQLWSGHEHLAAQAAEAGTAAKRNVFRLTA